MGGLLILYTVYSTHLNRIKDTYADSQIICSKLHSIVSIPTVENKIKKCILESIFAGYSPISQTKVFSGKIYSSIPIVQTLKMINFGKFTTTLTFSGKSHFYVKTFFVETVPLIICFLLYFLTRLSLS